MRAATVLLAEFAVIFFSSGLQCRAQIEKNGGELQQQRLNSFTEEEMSILQSLRIGSLPHLPEEPPQMLFLIIPMLFNLVKNYFPMSVSAQIIKYLAPPVTKPR